jgi:hypothetical protein
MSALWLDRRPSPISMTRVVYRLPDEVPYDRFDPDAADYVRVGTTPWVVVSHGRDGDTQIFPADEDGRICDTNGLVKYGLWDWWRDYDEALTEYLTDETVRNPLVDHPPVMEVAA